ncbi:MAG: DUF2950 domain-containing protein [Deltaproteobacteria bacterium]|nr:DUF2950 domain-containing protein [Deltaproteobacteria bacterium]
MISNAVIFIHRLFRRCALTALASSMLIATAFGLPAFAQDGGQKVFKTPQDAFKALVEAARENDTMGLIAIFGSDATDLVSSGDAVADTHSRERFVKAAQEKVEFSRLDDKSRLALIGKDRWCFPIPIVKSAKGWTFFTEDGKEEIINRRIGRNELNTIQVSLAYVNAQREYASVDRDGDGTLQYAQNFVSIKGMRDGLYWEAAPGEQRSPMGPFFARATEEGYSYVKDDKPLPYYGYYFRILKSQGTSAPGGAMDYVVDGKMTAGFALIAYPAHYGSSGVMTFIVNQQGVVYEKDLGPATEEAARALSAYDPDDTWVKVEQGK